MSDAAKVTEVEDVLSSIRRLVSKDGERAAQAGANADSNLKSGKMASRGDGSDISGSADKPAKSAPQKNTPDAANRLVLTPALMVVRPQAHSAEESSPEDVSADTPLPPKEAFFDEDSTASTPDAWLFGRRDAVKPGDASLRFISGREHDDANEPLNLGLKGRRLNLAVTEENYYEDEHAAVPKQDGDTTEGADDLSTRAETLRADHEEVAGAGVADAPADPADGDEAVAKVDDVVAVHFGRRAWHKNASIEDAEIAEAEPEPEPENSDTAHAEIDKPDAKAAAAEDVSEADYIDAEIEAEWGEVISFDQGTASDTLTPGDSAAVVADILREMERDNAAEKEPVVVLGTAATAIEKPESEAALDGEAIKADADEGFATDLHSAFRDVASIDENALRDLIAEVVREELQGTLGERITRNVRKLVRREIHRAVIAQDFE